MYNYEQNNRPSEKQLKASREDFLKKSSPLYNLLSLIECEKTILYTQDPINGIVRLIPEKTDLEVKIYKEIESIKQEIERNILKY